MPTDSILVAIGVCVMFLVLATALAWADHTTSKWLSNRATKRATAETESPLARRLEFYQDFLKTPEQAPISVL